MNIKIRNATKGVTLIEMLLVMVIVGMLIYMSIGYLLQQTQAMRVNKASAQIQQILNAGLSYYVNNGTWPATINDLATNGMYLQAQGFPNPWGNAYASKANAAGTLFYVYTPITSATASGSAAASANSVAGTLPMAYTTASNGTPPPAPGAGGNACTAGSTTCYVVASVNIPGQNFANIGSVNFAGLYHHGACVPVPTCPQNTTPQIMVVPVSVSGVNDSMSSNVYPISSFTAYARSNNAGTPTNTSPPLCLNTTGVAPSDCTQNNIGPTASAYWRVCMQIITERGDITMTNKASGPGNSWGWRGTMMAITRCSLSGESGGSDFSVFSN